MRPGPSALTCCLLLSLLQLQQSGSAPLTCYSRALGLSDEIMALLEKIHSDSRTKTCAAVLPTIFLDVHNQCVTSKLRDFLYVVLNHPSQSCMKRPRMVMLKRKVQNLHTIITRICFRDLVFRYDDCEAIDTGLVSPYFAEDRLQILQEER
ncbi:cytokine-like protein 1 [Kryptolebias marmoratus]|uniref:Cytokine like 1 n=1 Tax=Kryptolebias marmoratus TaxID=37003 RepID=A0A3Q2ZAF9_KRYMA|nr:cytokine-like protein 1 [Kryptolebias marmoratus]